MTNSTADEKLKMELIEHTRFYFDKAIETFNINKTYPKVSFDIRGNRLAGQARFSDYKIRYNLAIAKANKEMFLKRTPAHEVAHIICHILYPRASAHGYEWQSIMRKLGVSPSRCHSYNTSGIPPARKTQKFKYVCVNCGNDYMVGKKVHNKIQSGARYNCGKCKNKIIFMGDKK
jgi:SprT protein